MSLEDAMRPLRRSWSGRYRRVPKMADGRLAMVWASTRDEGPDVYVCRGVGVDRADGHLTYGAFCAPRLRQNFGCNGGPELVYDKSFLEELIDRGYDITTLKFSVQMKKKVVDETHG